MNILITTLAAALSVVLSVILVILGLDYMDPDIGKGLHPLIAFSVATLLICTAVTCTFFLISAEHQPVEEEDLMVKKY